MKNTALVGAGVALMLLVTMPLRAQAGCDDSPENPTVVLALVGGMGVLFSTMRTRMRARRGRSGGQGEE
jgi:XrtJ-associated TM-motif-TM protein